MNNMREQENIVSMLEKQLKDKVITVHTDKKVTKGTVIEVYAFILDEPYDHHILYFKLSKDGKEFDIEITPLDNIEVHGPVA